MLSIDMLPAGKGDCLWIEYGRGPDLRRLLVDGGMPGTAEVLRARISSMAPAPCRFELLVVTHIDLDHIGGILDLLRRPPSNLVLGDVWFNGWPQLEESAQRGMSEKISRSTSGTDDDDVLGVRQGEDLSGWIQAGGYPWNAAFGGGPVVIEPAGELPRRQLAGDLRLTLLAPTRQRLDALRQVWKEEVRWAGEKPGEVLLRLGEERSDRREEDEEILGAALDVEALARSRWPADASKANGTSIALLLEHDGKRCLLAGDSYAGDVTESVLGLAGEESESTLRIDALKLSHHGGRKSTSIELIESLACPRFLFSTNGAQHRHPDRESVARVIVHGKRSGLRPCLCFNYRTEQTSLWDDADLFRRYPYALEYPVPGEEGLRVEL